MSLVYIRQCNRCMWKHESEDHEGAKRVGWANFSLPRGGAIDLCPPCAEYIAKQCVSDTRGDREHPNK
jgi:hypothetical protein